MSADATSLLARVRLLMVGSDSACATQDERLPRRYFALCIALYVCYLLAMQPALLLDGEMWAEMATNYYANAQAPSLVARLMSTDAGYIPLPQRLLALLFHALALPASSIPYAYSWTAILLTAAMVGSFCLGPFRRVVQSDGLRLLVALSVLALADYETRTFINFTYFAAFFILILSALALVSDKMDAPPGWAWLTPVLMISKPAVVATLPGLLLAAILGRGRRYRWLAAASVVACCAQAAQMLLSRANGAFATPTTTSLPEKLYIGIEYAFGYLGVFTSGRPMRAGFLHPGMYGMAIAALLVALILFRKRRANALIPIGGLAIVFTTLLNALAFGDSWTADLPHLASSSIYRHVIVIFFGVTLIMAGLFANILPTAPPSSGPRRHAAPALFACWLIAAGWTSQAGRLNQQPQFPTINASYWQAQSYRIDSGAPVCVPINPIGWAYLRGCSPLVQELSWGGHSLNFQPISFSSGMGRLTIPIPEAALNGRGIQALAIAVKPTVAREQPFAARIVLTLKDESVRYLTGAMRLKPAGALLLIDASPPVLANQIAAAELQTDVPVEVARKAPSGDAPPALIWFGQ